MVNLFTVMRVVQSQKRKTKNVKPKTDKPKRVKPEKFFYLISRLASNLSQ
jgi:hypothetical protein